MSRDDLRALLEKIAATAGDPPEHGLDGVAARRRRRTRHRRGAVATAVALAVLGLAILPRLEQLGDDHDVTAAETGAPAHRAELPDEVELHCTPQGIVVPVASIQPQEDGLHVAIQNSLGHPIDVWVRARRTSGWYSGRVRMEPGQRSLIQPAPPGTLTIGCVINGRDEERQIELVDVDSIYNEPELSCPTDERDPLDDPPAVAAHPRYTKVVADALTGVGIQVAQGEVKPLDGYAQRFGYSTVEPRVYVERDGYVLVTAQLVPEDPEEDRPAHQPWVGVTDVELCPNLLDGEAPAGTGGTVPTS